MRKPDLKHIDFILKPWKKDIGADFDGYRNHVIRMAAFTMAQGDMSDDDQRKVEIAACFHDIGIWSHETWDYLPPSVSAGHNYLAENGLSDYGDDVEKMIELHHKIRPIKGSDQILVERFRHGDLIDVSFGAVRYGIPRQYIKEVKEEFPNCGFHKMLSGKFVSWLKKHPFNPAPMIKL